MPDQQPNPWKTLNTKTSFENPYFSISEHDVITPTGEAGYYGVIHFKRHAVGIIPIDEFGNTWLVGQFRYPQNSYEWEIPEGGADPGESPLDCARRELLEETGISASEWELLQEMQVSNSVTDEVSTTYVARGLNFAKSQPDPTEELVIRKLPLSEAIEMAMRGEIRDSISVAALLKLNCQQRATRTNRGTDSASAAS